MSKTDFFRILTNLNLQTFKTNAARDFWCHCNYKKNISITTSQFRLVEAKKHEAITVACSVIRLPNNRFRSKAFHINRKINHLSTSPGCVSVSHVFFHATTWIFGLTEYLHMESHPSLFLWIYIAVLFRQARQRNAIPSAALSHQCRLSSGFPHWRDTQLSSGKKRVLGPFSPSDLGFRGRRRSLPRVRSRKSRI